MRLTPAQFAILLALSRQEMHGYAILQDRAVRDGVPRLGPGTLYRSIKQLRAAGLIVGVDDRGDGTEDERRRYYRLTHAGRRAAEADAEALQALVGRAQRAGLLGSSAAAELS